MTRPPRSAVAVEAAVAAGGLLGPGRDVVVLLSGGRDSICLLDLAVRLGRPGGVIALHVDYGLRESAHDDAELCRRVCSRLGVELTVERPSPPAGGNLQAWARAERYERAAALARLRDADIAAGHTRDDQVETVLYRLAASPGRRALLGMLERQRGVVRPLLPIRREETAAYCAERGLEYADDPSNDQLRFARNRARHAVLPGWRMLHPHADENLVATLDVLRDEAAVLDGVVEQALRQAGSPPRLAALAALEPAVARLALQALADTAAGGRAPALGARAPELLALGRSGGSATLDLPGGLRAEVAYGELRFLAGPRTSAPTPDPARLAIPGSVVFAGGLLSSETGIFPVRDGSLDAAALDPELEIRAWRAGDRMRPLGLGGTKRVQDLLTDAKVPRARRAGLPVVLSGGDIAWIPGVATGEPFRVRETSPAHVRLSWAPPHYD